MPEIRVESVARIARTLCAELQGEAAEDAIPGLLTLLNETASAFCSAATRSSITSAQAFPAMRSLLAYCAMTRDPGPQAIAIYFAYLDRARAEILAAHDGMLALDAHNGKWWLYVKDRFFGLALRWHLFRMRVLGMRYWYGFPSRSGCSEFDLMIVAIFNLI
jgi:hypothetical protein